MLEHLARTAESVHVARWTCEGMACKSIYSEKRLLVVVPSCATARRLAGLCLDGINSTTHFIAGLQDTAVLLYSCQQLGDPLYTVQLYSCTIGYTQYGHHSRHARWHGAARTTSTTVYTSETRVSLSEAEVQLYQVTNYVVTITAPSIVGPAHSTCHTAHTSSTVRWRCHDRARVQVRCELRLCAARRRDFTLQL